MYNVSTNRLECRYCRIEMKAFGGRLTPRFGHMPEVWLCVHCGYSIDMQAGINEALLVRGTMRRRADRSRRYVETMNHYAMHRGGTEPMANGVVRQKLLELLIALLADEPKQLQ